MSAVEDTTYNRTTDTAACTLPNDGRYQGIDHYAVMYMLLYISSAVSSVSGSYYHNNCTLCVLRWCSMHMHGSWFLTLSALGLAGKTDAASQERTWRCKKMDHFSTQKDLIINFIKHQASLMRWWHVEHVIKTLDFYIPSFDRRSLWSISSIHDMSLMMLRQLWIFLYTKEFACLPLFIPLLNLS